MKSYLYTETGGHEVNEDHVLFKSHPADSSVWIACIADGQGGRAHGAEASAQACSAFYAAACELETRNLFDQATLHKLLVRTDDAVSQTGGFTTLIAAVLSYQQICGGSNGDSKMYLAASCAVDTMQEITQGQPKNPPVGCGNAAFTTFSLALADRARLLIVTDGVWKYAGYEALSQVIKMDSLRDAASVLKTAALERSGSSLPDDFSLIALENNLPL